MQRARETVRANPGFIRQQARALPPPLPKAHSWNWSFSLCHTSAHTQAPILPAHRMTSSTTRCKPEILSEGLCFSEELASALDEGIPQS